jgi:zinc transport system substrate-binding protein
MHRNCLNLIAIVLLILLAIITGCNSKLQETTTDKLKIYTTFYPLYDFASKITGEYGEIINLTPTGVEPHDFEPSPKQMASIYSADVFIYLGAPMDPWALKTAPSLSEKGVIVVEAGSGLIQDNDPHIWLDPILAKELACRIYEAITDADSAHTEHYRENYDALCKRFNELDLEYKNVLSNVKRRDIITSHSAFSYLARRYGLNQIPLSGLSPQAEPTPRRMAEIANFCRQMDVKYVFFETLASPKLSETLAHETGIKTLVLNPIGGITSDEANLGNDYFSIMRENLDNLRKALVE